MSLPSALEDFDRLAAEVGARRPAFFLDYDGTLSPIVDRPAAANLPPATRDAVQRLALRYPVAVVSGRARADVERRVGLPEVAYVGTHGFEIEGPGDDEPSLRHEPARELAPAIRRVSRALERELAEVEGSEVETKPYTVAVHYRRVPPERYPQVEAAVERQLAAHPGLRRGEGKRVFEIRPDMEWDKGHAVLWLLRALALDRPDVVPVYIGDDVTDEDVFRAFEGRAGGGIGIVVMDRPRPTGATYRLQDPDEVRELLERVASGALEPGGSHRRSARQDPEPR
ncbi:MAG: trehalose-phosphatase [Thermoanaerobaculia bacterium]